MKTFMVQKKIESKVYDPKGIYGTSLSTLASCAWIAVQLPHGKLCVCIQFLPPGFIVSIYFSPYGFQIVENI